MGMGLPVSKTIIEAHNGKLTAENRAEGGTCFCFTLQTAGTRGRHRVKRNQVRPMSTFPLRPRIDIYPA